MLKPGYDKKSPETNNEALSGAPATNDTSNGAGSQIDAPRFVAPTHGGVDILKLLTELEDLLEQSKRLPMGLMFRFDEDKFHMTIMKIRANLPEEMKRASKLVRDSEQIVQESREVAGRLVETARKTANDEVERLQSDVTRTRKEAEADAKNTRAAAEREASEIRSHAEAEAQRYIAKAQEQAAAMVSDSEIVMRAQIEAQELRARADADARAVHQGADDYAREVLSNLEGVLGKAMTVVQRGRETLEKPR